MKRVYESPVMMAEAFVANEYVAGCWTITCLGCDGNKVKKEYVHN